MSGFLLAVIAVVGVAGRSADDLALVGAAGEVYQRDPASPADSPTWKRQSGGGVATTLVGARGSSVKDVWGLGAATPAYRFDGTSWSASPLPVTGAAVMSTSGAPAVAVGRKVVVWSQSKWQQLQTLAVTGVVAVWAGGPKDAVVATAADLRRFDGTTWNIITPKMASATERIRVLQASTGGKVLAAGDEGTLLLVEKTTAKAVTMDTRVASFVGRLGAQSPSGQAYLLGSATVEGKARQAIVRLESNKLVLVDTLPALAADDAPVGMIVASDGGIVVATRLGVVHIRAAGGAWTRGTTEAELTEDTSHASNPPAVSEGTATATRSVTPKIVPASTSGTPQRTITP